MAKIAAEFFRQRVLESLPKGKAHGSHRASLPKGHRVVDLTGLSLVAGDTEFLEEAYRRVLRREPDVSGFLHHQEALRTGVPRELLIDRLLNSTEAQKLGYQFMGGPSRFQVAAAWIRYVNAAGLRLTRRRVIASLRALGNEFLQIGRVKRLEQRVDGLMNQVLVKTDQLFAKSDSNLWIVSEKMDAYTAEIFAKQKEVFTILKMSTEAASHEILRQNLELQRDFQQRIDTMLALESAGLRRRLEAIQSDLKMMTNTFATAIQHCEALFKNVQGVTACELDGLIIGVPSREWRTAAFHRFRGVMEPGLLTLFKKLLFPGAIVVDVGANVGLYTLQAARLIGPTGKIYSFEPTPTTFEVLLDNIQVNGFKELGIVSAEQIAIADKSGVATLFVHDRNSGHNTLFEDDAVDDRIIVKTASLDELLIDAQQVHVVKIDAEGAEPLILDGMGRIISENPEIRILMEFAPEHLRRAGIVPESFLQSIVERGLMYARIDKNSGDLQAFSDDKLVSESSNVLIGHPHLDDFKRR